MRRFYLKGEELNGYNYFIICHNIMLSIVKRANERNWNSQRIKIKKGDEKIWDTEDIEYLRTHGYKREINKSYYKHMFFCLLSDYLDYTYEANMAATKMKVNIAYSLLRKPLKDNLYFLELMEDKGIDFMNDFLEKPINNFDVAQYTHKEKEELLDRVASRVLSKKFGDVLYKIRYSKADEIGLERIWNKTQHIITNCEHYKTQDGNLNMIFNDYEDVKEFITYFYKVMPIIQTYVTKLVFKIVEKLGLINEIEILINNTLTTNRFLIFSNKERDKELDEIYNNTPFICPKCFKEIKLENGNEDILLSFYINCPNCNKKIDLDRFIFYDYHIEKGEYFSGKGKRTT